MAIYQGGRKVGAIVPVVMNGEYNIEQVVSGDECELNITTAGEIPKSKLPQVVDKTIDIITAEDLKGATKIGKRAFSGCRGLTSITIPDSATSIEEAAFQDCSGLTSVTIGSSVTSIEDNAFDNCSGLISINIPNSVTSIEGYAFAFCSSLTSITIPNGVSSIGNGVFYNCSKLTEMTILATTPPTLSDTNAISTATTTIYIPKGTLNAYQTATNWSDFASKFIEMEA